MLDEKGISERNQKLINFISGLGLGIHIIDLPESPKLATSDFKYLLHGYVKNFKIILMNKEFDGDIVLECRVDADPEQLRQKFVEWMAVYEHKRIYTITYEDLFLVGFNHHDKLNRLNAYPVFGRYFPKTYHKIEEAENTVNGFPDYNLQIK